MPVLPRLKEIQTSRRVIDSFGGYDHSERAGDGEFYDMQNLSSACAPLLASRPPRGTAAQLSQPRALLGRSKLAYIDGQRLFYGDAELTGALTAAGVAIGADDAQRRMVSMGAYICIFPDKLYINTENSADCGSMEARFECAGAVTLSLCSLEGAALTPTVSETEPVSPANGALWLDTSATPHALRQYSSATGAWSETPGSYVKLAAEGIGERFAAYDAVTLALGECGEGVSDALRAQVAALCGSKVIYARGGDHVVVSGILDEPVTLSTGASLSRTVPDMDFVTEAENRLWGCRYGQSGGAAVNEIYACALGDFKNWSRFAGLSTDSYRASVGTDGPFTGAVTHLGYPLFFKENALHKVYVSAQGAHRIVDTACRGVQRGSAESLCVVNETLYYKSASDVCAYDGSLPVAVSEKLGRVRYSNAAAGAVGDRYYISMQDPDERWALFVLDTARGMWHREDCTHALFLARCGPELYCARADGALLALCGTAGEREESVFWSATTGLMGRERAGRKYISRVDLRLSLPEGAYADLYVEYDSDGVWRHQGHLRGRGTGSFLIPLRPRRCDHFRFRIEGSGEMRLYSISRIRENGSDV